MPRMFSLPTISCEHTVRDRQMGGAQHTVRDKQVRDTQMRDTQMWDTQMRDTQMWDTQMRDTQMGGAQQCPDGKKTTLQNMRRNMRFVAMLGLCNEGVE
eukprot:365682-Chlamydomonas_euryale.AAC.20